MEPVDAYGGEKFGTGENGWQGVYTFSKQR